MALNFVRYVNWSRKNMLIAACVLIALVALYRWSISPHLQFLQAAENYKDAAGQIEKTYKTIDTELQVNQKKLGEISERFQRERQEFFEISAARNFLEGLQSTVEKKQCFVETLKFLPMKQIAVKDGNSINIQQYQVNLSVTGRYMDIVRLLDSLQNIKQKVWIDMIDLRLKNQTTGYLVCGMSLSVYALKIEEI